MLMKIGGLLMKVSRSAIVYPDVLEESPRPLGDLPLPPSGAPGAKRSMPTLDLSPDKIYILVNIYP
jgi:hypothetical protein